MTAWFVRCACASYALAALYAPGGNAFAGENGEFSQSQRSIILRLSPLPEAPADATNAFADDPRAAHLGQFLFFERRWSANGQVACATCHQPAAAFADGQPLGQGVGPTARHTAALWNVAHNRWFFWDGRADSLWAQAVQPLENANELASSRLQIAHFLYADAQLRTAYENIFGPLPDLSAGDRFPSAGRPVPADSSHPHHQAWQAMQPADQDAINRILVNVAKSIAAYERKIVSCDSPFDRFVKGLRDGDGQAEAAYPPAARRGLTLFIGKGNCRLCHSGANFSDSEFHDTRLPLPGGGVSGDSGRYTGAQQVMQDPFNAAGPYSDKRDGPACDKLSFLANGRQNWGLFKTPTLRNVALTAPYMHLGQLPTLRDVVNHYSRLPDAAESHHPERILVRLDLTESEIDELVAFLESLTSPPLDASLTRQPASPLPEPAALGLGAGG